jgi:hypothetical protein
LAGKEASTTTHTANALAILLRRQLPTGGCESSIRELGSALTLWLPAFSCMHRRLWAGASGVCGERKRDELFTSLSRSGTTTTWEVRSAAIPCRARYQFTAGRKSGCRLSSVASSYSPSRQTQQNGWGPPLFKVWNSHHRPEDVRCSFPVGRHHCTILQFFTSTHPQDPGRELGLGYTLRGALLRARKEYTSTV